ncbi:MAG: TlyA family RNA methyltransferase [Phycisphaerales bacterium]
MTPSDSPAEPNNPFVSRGGLKLAHALDAFGLDPAGLTCADLGCSTGGFTDCLLQRRAASVVCVDTAYGELAWKLRQDPRVTVRERTNALHAEPDEPVDLVVIDIGWTPQRLALPAAARWLRPGGRIISLVKPHYELSDAERAIGGDAGVLDPETARRVARRVLDDAAELGFRTLDLTNSPILGGGKRSKSKTRGNIELLALIELRPRSETAPRDE